MKILGQIVSLLGLAGLLLSACIPAVDTQAIIETGIAATAQISQLETAAAGNGAQSEDQANQPVQNQELVNFGFVNNNTTVCSIETYVNDQAVNLLEGFFLDPGKITYFSLPSGIYDIYVYDCNSNLVDQLDGVQIDSTTTGIDSNGTGEVESQSSTNSGAGSPMFTVSQETNCRYGPSSSNFDIRETIFAGQSVPIVGVGNSPAQEWWVVTVDGLDCWMWGGGGQASGDTQSVAGINPPAIPTVQQGQGDGGNEEDFEDCGDLTNNPAVTINPWSGKHPTKFTFSITGYQPNYHFGFEISYKGEVVYKTDGTTDEVGSFTLSLWTEASDEPGTYLVFVGSVCADVETTFSIEP